MCFQLQQQQQQQREKKPIRNVSFIKYEYNSMSECSMLNVDQLNSTQLDRLRSRQKSINNSQNQTTGYNIVVYY